MKISANGIFCLASLVLTVGLSFVIYPYAKLSSSELENLSQAKPMEAFEELIDLGEDFGPLTMFDLMGYYLDNPPAAKNTATGNTAPVRQFGGC